MFMMFKHIHASIAVLSLVFLLLRVFLAWRDASKLDQKWLKIVPHAIDGLFVLSVISMIVVSGLYPFSATFATEKLLGFILYIVFSVLTVLSLRGRFSDKLKAPFTALAILTWFWMVKVALMKQAIVLAAV